MIILINVAHCYINAITDYQHFDIPHVFSIRIIKDYIVDITIILSEELFISV